MLRPGRLAYFKFQRAEDAGGKSIALEEGVSSVRVDGGGRLGRRALVVAAGERTYRFRHSDPEELVTWAAAVAHSWTPTRRVRNFYFLVE